MGCLRLWPRMEALELALVKNWNSELWANFESQLKVGVADFDLLSSQLTEDDVELIWKHVEENEVEIEEIRYHDAHPFRFFARLAKFPTMRTLSVGFRQDYTYEEAEALSGLNLPRLEAASLNLTTAEFMLPDELERFKVHLRLLCTSATEVRRVRIVAADWGLALDTLYWLPTSLQGLILSPARFSEIKDVEELCCLLLRLGCLCTLILPPTLLLHGPELQNRFFAACANFSTTLRHLGLPRALRPLHDHLKQCLPELKIIEEWRLEDENAALKVAEKRAQSGLLRRRSTLINLEYYQRLAWSRSGDLSTCSREESSKNGSEEEEEKEGSGEARRAVRRAARLSAGLQMIDAERKAQQATRFKQIQEELQKEKEELQLEAEKEQLAAATEAKAAARKEAAQNHEEVRKRTRRLQSSRNGLSRSVFGL